MPTPNMTGDFMLAGMPYMLARDPQHKAIAWQRTGVVDSLSTTKRTARAVYGLDDGEDYGGLPDELDHPEVYDDWSGGYGSYRRHLTQAQNHYHVALNFDPRFPRQLFHAQQPQMLAAAYASAASGFDYVMDMPVANTPAGAGKVLLIGGAGLAYLTPTKHPYTAGSAFDMTVNFSPDGRAYGHRPAVFGSFTYVPQCLTASEAPLIRLSSGEGFVGTFGPLPARWFTVAGGRLWRGHGRGLVQSCAIGADPLVTGNWSATLNLGNGQMVSQDAISLEDRMFVGFPDGVYMGDVTGTFNNVATDVGFNVNADNVRDMTVHNGMVVFPEGGHVWGYRPPTGGGSSVMRQLWPVIDVQPFSSLFDSLALIDIPNLIPVAGLTVRGNVRAVHGFGRWLYAGVFTGTHSIVYCGQEASAGLPYVWHPMQFLPKCKVSRIHVDAITAASDGTPIPRRIWVATDASYGAQTGCTAPVYYWPIPVGDESPLADATFSPNYTNIAAMEHGITDYGAPGTWKIHRKIEWWWQASASGGDPSLPSTAAADIRVFPILDATMAAVVAGTQPTLDPRAMRQTVKDMAYFRNLNGDAVAQQMNFGFVSEAQMPSLLTPIHQALVVRNTFRPRTNDTITAKVRIADHIPDRQGNEMRDGATMLAELRGYANSSQPYQLLDLVGATLPVVVLPPIDEDVAYQGGSDYPEVVATVKMGVLDATWGVSGVSGGFQPRWG